MKNIMNLVKLSFNNFMAIKNIAMFILICFVISSIFNPQFGLILIGLGTYVISYQTMAYEDSYGIDYLICNLPVTRKQYVISRYIFSIVALILACLLYTLVYYISFKFNLATELSMGYKTNLLIGIFSALNLISVTVPVLLYFGMKKGRMAIILVFMVFVGMPSAVFNDAQQMMWIIDKINEMNITLVSALFSFVLMIISYIISNYLYANKQITE